MFVKFGGKKFETRRKLEKKRKSYSVIFLHKNEKFLKLHKESPRKRAKQHLTKLS